MQQSAGITDKLDASQSKRIDFISWIQFLGVLSVIIGHSMNSIDVPVAFTTIKAWIYTWHMPLFFLVSAFLFSYKGGFAKGYKKVFGNRCMRLLVPYVIWNAAFILPKIIFARFIEDQVELTPAYFFKVLLFPRDNILGHTWFLAALFLMFLLAIAFEKCRKNKNLWIPMTCFLVVLNCLSQEYYFAADQLIFKRIYRFLALGDLCKNAIFFWVGLLLGGVQLEKTVAYFKEKSASLAIGIIVLVTTCVWCFFRESTANLLLLGMSALALFAVLQLKLNIRWRFIDFVSVNAFPIYIMHWPVMMVIRLIVYSILHLNPILTMVIMLLGGVLIPVAIVWVLRKIKVRFIKMLCKIVLGM